MRVIIVFISTLFLFQSCEITKKLKRNSSDSTAVSKLTTSLIDTSGGGSVSKTTMVSKEDFDWWRTTMQYKGDTSVTNVYPSTIIYEGGKGSKQSETNEVDSSWFKNALAIIQAQSDSISVIKESFEKNKQSETKGVGLVMVILICAGFWVVSKLFGLITSKYSIVKKVVS